MGKVYLSLSFKTMRGRKKLFQLVTMARTETVAMAIDEAGESWVGRGQPVTGEGAMVKVTYELRGTPGEVEMPFVPAKR